MARPRVNLLGIDIGGSGIKGAIVNTNKGELVTERHRIETPQPATPNAVAATVKEIIEHFDYEGSVGCTFPAIVRRGVTLSAANVDKSWIGTDADALFEKETGLPFTVLNDADAAGIAEMAFGAGRDQAGVVFMITFGTGIGTALFIDGQLVPNTELGHIELNDREVEPWASAQAREKKDLSWKKWAKRVNKYLNYLDTLFSPDLYIIGGGVSKKSDKFFKHLKTGVPVVAAQLLNEAGIVGAASLAAASTQKTSGKAPAKKTVPRKTSSKTGSSTASKKPTSTRAKTAKTRASTKAARTTEKTAAKPAARASAAKKTAAKTATKTVAKSTKKPTAKKPASKSTRSSGAAKPKTSRRASTQKPS